MRETHALACIAGAGWLVIVAFATGSFLLGLLLVAAYTPIETIHDIRERSPYVQEGAR